MLVSAGIELISFTAAGAGLQVGSVLGTALLTQGCLLMAEQGLRAPRPLLLLTPPPTSGLGGHEELGGGTAGTAEPTGPGDVPHRMDPAQQ